MKKIKSVKRNGLGYNRAAVDYWSSTVRIGTLTEWVHEDVIRNCPLFEVEYEKESWKAEIGGLFYYVGFHREPSESYDYGNRFAIDCHESGNYFKTEEQVQRFINLTNPILERFHREEGNYE